MIKTETCYTVHCDDVTVDPNACPMSQRVDGKQHSWAFDGDDPYIKCHFCDQLRDAITGKVLSPGRTIAAETANGEEVSGDG